MKILIVGGGGREHALAWKAAQSVEVSHVYVAPGNAGTAREAKVENIPLAADNIAGLLDFALKNSIDLSIIGPEVPLVEGIVDEFQNQGLACFGPCKQAAQLEGSKSFSKDFFVRHNIPSADYQHFTDVTAALAYVHEKGAPIVIKADGLAAGKGVVVAQTESEASAAVTDMLSDNKFGDAGQSIVIEEFLEGEEASFIVVCDGEHSLPLASSQDHKARDEGDRGPNTGGMGAYSPAPVVDDKMHDIIMREVIEPAVAGMKKDGSPYVGFLYAGIMVTPSGEPKVLEFNCRFGDPETQPILMRLQSDLIEMCNMALQGKLDQHQLRWDERAALGIVMASAGYPENASKGDLIEGLDSIDNDNVKTFHAGTELKNQQVFTAGGRVLCVTALGDSVSEAQKSAYSGATKISCTGMFFRNDIGYRAVNREKSENN
ncbi:MAG: phosphoribosylamine--glycine ligase [Gammaproteobacteria bacterium]|nr:phosphoribosylamine--glycine ligase [Gammaproteobacteria bacterium]